jgi:hypothetical protein
MDSPSTSANATEPERRVIPTPRALGDASGDRERKPDTGATYQNGTSYEELWDCYDAERRGLRPFYKRAGRSTLASRRHKLRAVASTRPYLILARKNPASFSKYCRTRLGIKCGRLETKLLRSIYDIATLHGRTSVNRWADALAWMVDNCDGQTDDQTVDTVLRRGGLCKVARLYRAPIQAAKHKLIQPAPTFVQEMLRKLDEFEPDLTAGRPNSLSVRLEYIDLSGMSHLYARIPVEKLIRDAMAALQIIHRTGLRET